MRKAHALPHHEAYTPLVSTAARAGRIEDLLWPYLDRVVESWAVPGLAVAVVHDGDQLLTRGLGSRTSATGQPVTPDTLFHLASVSKTFVATAAIQLAEEGLLDLDDPITAYLPDLSWADPRAQAITVAHVLSHQSGIGDVAGDYGWHEPELDDGALGRFAAHVATWPLKHDPGTTFSYSNAAYELLGHLIATVGGMTFEAHLKERVLVPAGMSRSTFLRAEVPADRGALPHLGLPLRVVEGSYPYTRRHSPSSTLHSSAAELGTWIMTNLAGGTGVLSPASHQLMWDPVAETDWGGMNAQVSLGWFWGPHGAHRVVNHSGDDPGFLSSLAIVPELGAGVAVLANSNTTPTFSITKAALDVLYGQDPPDPPTPPVTVPLAPVLGERGVQAAADLYHRLAGEEPQRFDLGPDGFEEAAWGVIEMHRTDLVWPLLQLWGEVHPDSSGLALMTGWAHANEGRRDLAIEHIQRALELDPDNDEAADLLRHYTSGSGAEASR